MVYIRGEICVLCRKEIMPGDYVEHVGVGGKLRGQHVNCLKPDDFGQLIAAGHRLLKWAEGD